MIDLRTDIDCYFPDEDVPKFWENVETGALATTECWLWKGLVNSGGYGTYRVLGKQMQARRIAYVLQKKVPLPSYDLLLKDQECTNILCVNPAHHRHSPSTPEREQRARARKRWYMLWPPRAHAIAGLGAFEELRRSAEMMLEASRCLAERAEVLDSRGQRGESHPQAGQRRAPRGDGEPQEGVPGG